MHLGVSERGGQRGGCGLQRAPRVVHAVRRVLAQEARQAGDDNARARAELDAHARSRGGLPGTEA